MLDHLALQVADVDAAATSYTQVFPTCGVRERMRHEGPGGAAVGLCGPDSSPRLWPGYHPGYHDVFVRDPDGTDGTDVQAVHHTWPAS